MPSSDVARDLAFYRDVLGGEVVFAIERSARSVARLKLAEHGPRLLLAGRLVVSRQGGQSGGEDMEFKSGDRVKVESESTERPPRTGVIEEVVQGTA